MIAPWATDRPARTTATGTLMNQPSGNSDRVLVEIDVPGPPPDWHKGARLMLVPILPEDAT